MVAEAFGTLASLHPGRIDLGVGRAPGTDQITAQALRRNLNQDINGFPQDVVELLSYFGEPQPGQHVIAVPGAGLDVPVWILGSSLFGAQLAAALGLLLTLLHPISRQRKWSAQSKFIARVLSHLAISTSPM